MQRTDWCFQEGWGVGMNEMGEGDQEIHTSSYKISKPWGCNIHQGKKRKEKKPLPDTGS